MTETLELRVDYKYAHLLFKEDEGRNIDTTVKVVQLSTDDDRYKLMPIIQNQLREKYNKLFFYGWKIKRKYTLDEINAAPLFHMNIKLPFEPTGEGETQYDEDTACKICGANRTQIGPLRFSKWSMNKYDIATNIAGEVIVSEKLEAAFKARGLKGAVFNDILVKKKLSKYKQIVATTLLELSPNTLAGVNPFDFSDRSGEEIYKCPLGHTIGLNLLSELYIENNISIQDNDFFATRQHTGVRRGELRPSPFYLCSQAFRKMVLEENLKGFNFWVAHVE